MEDTTVTAPKNQAAQMLGAKGGRAYADRLKATHTPEEISARMKAVRAQAFAQLIKTDHLTYKNVPVRVHWLRSGKRFLMEAEMGTGVVDDFIPLPADVDIAAVYAEAVFVKQEVAG